MQNQPVPVVSPDDVERIVRRDFGVEEFDVVKEVLNDYGIEKCEGERSRVQLATLRMAHGSLEALRRYVVAAKQDYRDVLAAAEYPEYSTKGFRIRELPKEEQRRIMDADWKQYKSGLQE